MSHAHCVRRSSKVIQPIYQEWEEDEEEEEEGEGVGEEGEEVGSDTYFTHTLLTF